MSGKTSANSIPVTINTGMGKIKSVLTASVYASAVIILNMGISYASASRAALIIVLIMCASEDVRRKLIPARLIACGLIMTGALQLLDFRGAELLKAAENIIGAGLMYAALFTFTVIYEAARGRKVLGGGDIRLLLLTGACLGIWSNLVILFLSCITGGAELILLKEKEVPLAPHIALAAFSALVGHIKMG